MTLTLSVSMAVADAAELTPYPEKPIRVIVGFPAGSQPDAVARLLGQKLTEAWGKPVLIENAAGAGGNIATERVAKAAPDGYTLGLLSQGQIVTNPLLYKLAYDPVKDLAPVSQVNVSYTILVVHTALPTKSVKELVALAKAQPGALTFASGGSGSSPQMAAELFKSTAGLDIRIIPYKGVVAAIPDLLGGRVTTMFSPIVAVLPMVREGKLRALAVSSLRRSSAVPEVPTIAESGFPGFDYTSWGGLFGPARTPPNIVRKLHLETAKTLALPEIRTKLADLGVEAIGNSPEAFASLIQSEIPKWAKVIRDSGIKPD